MSHAQAVSYSVLLAAIAGARDGDPLEPAEASILRLLVFQFFRENPTLAEYADTELAMIFEGCPNDDVEEDEAPLDHEALMARHEDPTRPDYGPTRPTFCSTAHYDRFKTKPVAIRCSEPPAVPASLPS